MTDRADICQAVEDRLLDGERLTGHPELVDHAGSCLDCFRRLTELRDLPRIAEMMRTEAGDQARENDPGPAFWKAMPERVADEVLGPRRRAQAARRRWWAPATLMSGGLLAAAALALVVAYYPVVTKVATKTATKTAMTTARAQALPGAPVLAAATETDDNLPVGDLANLSATQLRALNQRLTREEMGAMRVLTDPGTDLLADEDGEGTALERLASLGEPELQRLTHSLGLELE